MTIKCAVHLGELPPFSPRRSIYGRPSDLWARYENYDISAKRRSPTGGGNQESNNIRLHFQELAWTGCSSHNSAEDAFTRWNWDESTLWSFHLFWNWTRLVKLLQDAFTLKLKLIWLQLLIFAPGGNFDPDKYFLHQNCIEKAKETNFKLAPLVGIPATKTACHHNLAYLVKTSQCPWNQKLVYLVPKLGVPCA